LLTDNTVKCWGDNSGGQVNPTNLTTTYYGAPVAVAGLTSISAIAVGTSHACAVNATGTTYCWGNNGQGAVGSGTEDATTKITTVDVGTTANRISASYHTCVISGAGSLVCWGFSSSGQLGVDVTPGSFTTVPQWPPLSTKSNAVAPGMSHSCVIGSDQTVKCFGANNAGQLGSALTVTNSTTALNVPNLGSATMIASKFDFNCALAKFTTSSTAVQCWGDNRYGELGIPSTTQNDYNSHAIPLTGTPTAVSVGFHHACALQSDGAVYCWGRNNYGQLGNDDSLGVDSAQPVAVVGL
jgi:alpha-tubulin suppressor-like RCC1 family protein